MVMQKKRKVPFVEEVQKTECGLCCVCMINRYYKNNITMRELREQLDVGRDGSNFQQLNQLLKKYNFDTKAYNIPADKLYCLDLPAIIFWQNNHFVILEKINSKMFYIVDPAIGRQKMTIEEFSEGYSGYALTMKPNKYFKRIKRKENNWKYFSDCLLKNKLLYMIIISMSIISYLFTIGLPVIIKEIIDNIVSGKNYGKISHLFILMIFFSILYFLITFLKNDYLIKLRAFLDKLLSTKIFKHLLYLPYKFFSVRSSGDIIYTVNSSFRIREIFANNFITGVIDCGAVCIILIYMFSSSFFLGAIASTLFIVNIIVVSLTQSTIIENNRSLITTQSKVQGVQVETVYSILGVKMCAIEDEMLDNWKLKYNNYYNKYCYNEKVNNCILSTISYLQFFSPIIILFASIYLSLKHLISIGQVVAFYSLSTTFFGLSSSVFNMWTGFINSGVLFDRLSDIVGNEVEIDDTNSRKINLLGDIKLDNVSFKYTKNSKYILKDISLSINNGDKVAIVGKSGSGKSTLARLLVGLYAPTEGDIYFDNFNFKDLNKKYIRKQLGIVPQDITLFNKSIFDNIVMNRDNISLEEVQNACKIACIDDEIEDMPMKYYTGISEMGLNLSGGQRQRIALARAIINKPKILLLDEATSSLDNINERKISDEFKKMGTTQIVVAHRLSTIIDADLIIVLDDGKIVEEGTHKQLLERKSYYSRLYSSVL